MLTNIGYVGGSYDIFKANPHAIGQLDPGFLSGQNIFEFTYNDGLTTTDGVYAIPDGTSVNSVESCSFSFSSSVSRNTQSYSNSLKVHVDASFKYYGASFSASSDYQSVHQGTSSGEYVYVSSQAECQTYGASIDDAPFSSVFISDVANLPTPSPGPSPYLDFIRTWGTHVASSIMMGGRYGLRSQFTSSKYNSMTSTKFNVKAAGGYSGVCSVSASLATDVQKEQAATFDSNRKEYQIYQLGGKPPVDENGTAFEWAQTVKNAPMPLSYKLTELFKYLNSRYFPNDVNITMKQTNLQQAVAQYCRETTPNPALCDQQYGPGTNKSVIRVSLLNDIIPSSDTMSFYQYSENPNMRSFGAVRGYLSVHLPIPSPFVMADIRFASPNVTRNATGIIGDSEDYTVERLTCPTGFSTITEQIALKENYKSPSIPCIADHCLTQCSRGSKCLSFYGDECYFIGSGFTELGNPGDRGFFRDLTIHDSTPESDLFKCLTYECLEVV